jgi:cytoskeletal protein RodZ
MTTREEARQHAAELRRELRSDAASRGLADALPGLPERLYAARERKGVDLYRAERDTKIRARYLGALERGEWRELPGAVYTKGFLRNYAIYLGLDPDEVVRQWKHERGDVPAVTPAITVPRPLQAPRQGITFSPVAIVALLLFLLVAAFVAYLGIQLVRFAKPPTLAVTAPAMAVVDVPEDTATYVLRGTSIAGATITVTAPGRDQPYRVTADANGRSSAEVELRRGKNQFDITALDPETGKTAETPARVFITVPFLVIVTPELEITSPADRSAYENGAVPVSGTVTNAERVVVSATYLGPADGEPVASPAPSASPVAGPTVPSVTAQVTDDGSFTTPLELSTGRWSVVITATSDNGKVVTVTREVTIQYKGVTLVVSIKGPTARAWLKVWVDGKVSSVTGDLGKVFNAGKVLTFTAQESVEVRTGASSVTYFTLNGKDLGRFSDRGNPETWLFHPPDEPKKTNRR